MNPLLVLDQIDLAFGPRQVLHRVGYTLYPGEILGVVGESGSGKTLSALTAIALLPPGARLLHGEVHYRGQSLHRLPERARVGLRGRGIGMVFQDPLAALNPVRRIGAQLVEVLRLHQGLDRRAAWAQARVWLERVRLPERCLSAYPHELSGGQRQRALLALALACGPEVLLCDEPTSALDSTTQREAIDLLLELKQSQGLSLVFISHDLALVAEICDRVVVMRQGRVVESGPTAEVWRAPRHPYTRGLLAARPKLYGNPARLPELGDFIDAEGRPRSPDPIRSTPAPPRPPPRGETILRVSGLCLGYPAAGWTRLWRPPTPAFTGIDLELCRGETLGIVGESGSGKTSLARTLVRLERPTAGRIEFAGVDWGALPEARLRPLRRRMQMVFQDPYASLNPQQRIGAALAEPLWVHGLVRGRAEAERRVRALLAEVGLEADAAERRPHQFSGGQRQRIAIARALAVEPELLICDEAVSALDVSVQAQILNLLADLRDRRGLSMIFIAHDLAVIGFIADRVAVMHRGRIVEQGPTEAVLRAPQSAHGRALLAALPRPRLAGSAASAAAEPPMPQSE